MTRVSVVKGKMLGKWAVQYSAGAADVPMAAADAVNGNKVIGSGYDLILVHNTAGSAQTVTINSVPDPVTNRPGPITDYSVGAGEYAVFGPFGLRGWATEDNERVYEVTASSAEVYIGAVSFGFVETVDFPLMAYEDGVLCAFEDDGLVIYGC